jgi:hypothetical protein
MADMRREGIYKYIKIGHKVVKDFNNIYPRLFLTWSSYFVSGMKTTPTGLLDCLKYFKQECKHYFQIVKSL